MVSHRRKKRRQLAVEPGKGATAICSFVARNLDRSESQTGPKISDSSWQGVEIDSGFGVADLAFNV